MGVLVIMGVSGCGKSVVGAQVAKRLGFNFVDADHYHPDANIKKMSCGKALTDEDRVPWLIKLASLIQEWTDQGQDVVLACSALKRQYRTMLLGPHQKYRNSVCFIHLHGAPSLIAERMAHRQGHYMKKQMLEGQLAILEPLEEDERGIVIDDLSFPPDQIAATVVDQIGSLAL